MKILYFRMRAPLQSWGERSHWDMRDTSEWPTKSGVVGMISAAMGLSYDDVRIGEICESLEMGVKASQHYMPQLLDFQVTDYYNGMRADGTRETRSSQRGIVQKKYYLDDKCFLVGLKGEENLLEEITAAMKNPCWMMTLGRYCCIPSEPIIPTITDQYATMEEFLENTLLFSEEQSNESDDDMIIQIESKYGEPRQDVRLAVAGRVYGKRTVIVKPCCKKEE